MSSDSVERKESQDVEVCHNHEEVHVETDIPLSKHRRLKWKLDLLILPLISSVYFFASMVGSNNIPW